MARGPKKHMKRLNAPKHWMLAKMDGIWAPRPSQGPHKLRECLPLVLILRNRLKYALTGRETKQICMEKHVKVDGRTRTDPNFPAGFMDVVEIEKAGDQFRLMYDTKGRYVLHKISDEEKKFKLCRVKKVELTLKKVPYVVTHDGRTIRYPDPLAKVNDTVKVDIETGKIIDIVKFNVGATCIITKGRNTGRVGQISKLDIHEGSFNIVTVKDAAGHSFSTRQSNVFVLGAGEESLVSLPKANGVRLSIIEEASIASKKRKEAMIL
jgi:ribosomal protein S4E